MPRKITLVKGDCFKDLPIERCVDLIVTDPPYDITKISDGGSVNDKKCLNKSLMDLKKVSDVTLGYDIYRFSRLVLFWQENINCYFFCNKRQIPEYFRVYVQELKCRFDIICWHKKDALPTYSNKYLSDTEYCLHFYRGKGQTHPQSYEDAKTYYLDYINRNDKKLYGHPTIKPLPLIEKIIRNSSKKGDLVIDPFMGSGTTGVACKKLGRDFIGVEINRAYFRIARKRIIESLEEQK